MVSLRKSRKQALLAAAGAGTHRRSARLLELEERKRQEEAARAAAAAAQAQAKAQAQAQDTGQPPASPGQATGRKRGRKRKHVSEVTVSSVYEEGHGSQWQAGPSFTGSSSGHQLNGTPLPRRKTLEAVLDILQLMDSGSRLAMPNNLQLQESEFEYNLSRPKDFGTVRAKLHEEYYATFEHFESDVFSVTSRAKRLNQPETPLHKLAATIEQKGAEIFRALRTQPGFELHILKWAARNRKTTGQLRIGSRAAASAGGTSSSPWPTPPSAASDGKELANTAPCRRPCSTAANRGLRRAASARSGAGARRYRRTCEVTPTATVHSRDDRQSQCPPDGRRWTYLQHGQPQDMYGMVLQSPQQLMGEVRVGTEISYEESLMRFARAGGPIAESIARKVMEEQRAAIMEKMERRNQLPLVPAAQFQPPEPNSSDVISPAPHLPAPYAGLLTAQGGMLFGSQGGPAGSPPSAFYDLTTMLGPGPSASTSTADPTGMSGFSFPPPSNISASCAGLLGSGVSQSYWPTSDVGNSSSAAGYNYSHAANVPSSATMVGREGSARRGSSMGDGSSTTGFLFGPRRLNYSPLFATATSAAPGYQSPAPARQADMSELLQFGSCSKIAGSTSGQLSADPVDGFQYLLSSSSDLPAGAVLGGGPSGATSADGSTSMFFPGGKKQAAIDSQQPEPRSQAVFDLKLLQSRLGENPWGKNGISALRPRGFNANIISNKPSSMEAGPSNVHPTELSTLDLLGGRNPDLNLNL